MDQRPTELLRDWLSEKRGRQVALAAHVRVRPSVVGAWISGRRPVPVEHGAQIEEFTLGRVSRVVLFPGEWRRIWPELIDQSAPDNPAKNPAPALASQAQGAINSEARQAAQEVA